MTDRVSKARKAFRKKDFKETKKAHSKKAVASSLESHKNSGGYVGDFVYGAIDGSVTTFAVVSGVAGAALNSNIVIILGLANLFADGLSMAIGNYLSSKSNMEYIASERKREEWEVDHYPKGEVAEIREIYRKKGFKGKDLEKAVKIITSNKKVWIDTMMTDELGLLAEKENPIKKGTVTFISFLIVGAIPLLAYFFGMKDNAYIVSTMLTFMAFFTVGAAKVFVTGKNWFMSGMETLLIGGVAAIVAYTIGFLLRGLA